MAILLKAMYTFNVILIKIPMAFFFAEMEKQILKFIWNCKESQLAKTFLKKNKSGELPPPDFKSYHKDTVIETVWYWHKDIYIYIYNQWNKTESPETNPPTYSQSIDFNKCVKTVRWGKEQSLQQCARTTGCPHTQERSWILTTHHI